MEKSENEILLSIIIPVYNVEKYIVECIESVVSQCGNECEIILVNDGSTDSSGTICAQYAQSYSYIKLVNKENGGLSSARNEGIKIAKGKYITFIDSDDKLFPSSLQNVLSWIKNEDADICFLRAVKLFPNGNMSDLNECIDRKKIYKKSKKNAIHYLAHRPKYPGSAWAKLLKRDLIVGNGIHFPYDKRFSEDLGFIRDCLLYANSFDALNFSYYLYRQKREGSITNKVSTNNFYDLLQFIIESIEMLTTNKKAKDSISRCLMGFVAYEYVVLMHVLNGVAVQDFPNALEEIKKYRWVLKYSRSFKIRVISVLCLIIGIEKTAKITTQYRRATNK